jgi:two-component system, NarL family, nitrate/nitrite response regulator NarL
LIVKVAAHSILIADDHPLYRSALAELIDRSEEFLLLGAVDDLAAALSTVKAAQARGSNCHLALLDLNMPGMDGVAGIRTLRKLAPETKIVLISGNLQPTIVGDALAAGVSGFVPKSFNPDVILAAIRLVLTGAIYVPHDLVTPAPAAVSAEHETNVGTTARPALTPREIDVLTRMARGETYKEIARAVGIAEITVKLHAQRITRKLGVKNRAAAIGAAVKAGLIEIG